MTEIELTVDKNTAENVVEELENKAQRIENVLQSFRANELTDTEEYNNLLSTQNQLAAKIDKIQEQIDEQEPEGLGNLFG
jgi:hypothetical protein